MKKNKKDNEVTLFDKLNKVYVLIKIGENKKWERWISETKKTWIKTHESLSFDEIMMIKEQVVLNNYNNLYSIIVDKK